MEDSMMMIPIKLHICLAGMFSMSYNFFRVYVLPMMSAIVLNLCMKCCWVVGTNHTQSQVAYLLCVYHVF